MTSTHNQLVELPLVSVYADSKQARTHFDEKSLDSLAESISQHGILQPIVVHTPDTDGRHKIIAGERRYRAAKRLGLYVLPAIVRATDDPANLLSLQIVENLQRDPLNLADTMAGVGKLVRMPGENGQPLGVRGAAKQLGKSPSWISRRANLDSMSDLARGAVLDGEISDPDLADAFDKLAEIDADRASELYDWHVSGRWLLSREAVRDELKRAQQRSDTRETATATDQATADTSAPAAASPAEKPQTAELSGARKAPVAKPTPAKKAAASRPQAPTESDCILRATVNELARHAGTSAGNAVVVRLCDGASPIVTEPMALADTPADLLASGPAADLAKLLSAISDERGHVTLQIATNGREMIRAIKKLSRQPPRRTGKASVSDALQTAVTKWLADCTRQDDTGGILASKARELFNAWHTANGGDPVSINKLGVAMTNAGVTKARSSDNRVMYVGITHTGT